MMGYAFQIFFLGGIELYMIAGIVGYYLERFLIHSFLYRHHLIRKCHMSYYEEAMLLSYSSLLAN